MQDEAVATSLSFTRPTNTIYSIGATKLKQRLAPFPQGIQLIACGSEHTIILTNDKKVYGFGNNNKYQLSCDLPKDVVGTVTKLSGILPIPSPIKTVHCGYYHTGYVTENNELYVLGSMVNKHENKIIYMKQFIKDGIRNLKFQVASCYLLTEITGTLYHVSKNCKQLNKIEGMPKLIKVDCGGLHLLAISKDFKLYGLGSNVAGQLGINSNDNERTKPVLIETGKLKGKEIVDVCCGDVSSLVMTACKKIFFWGCLSTSLDAKTKILVPTLLATSKPARCIASGSEHMVILLESGEVLGFGNNKSHQLMGIVGCSTPLSSSSSPLIDVKESNNSPMIGESAKSPGPNNDNEYIDSLEKMLTVASINQQSYQIACGADCTYIYSRSGCAVDLPIFSKKFQIVPTEKSSQGILGVGVEGCVYLCVDKQQTNNFYAAKKLKSDDESFYFTRQKLIQLYNELELSFHIKQKHVIRTFGLAVEIPQKLQRIEQQRNSTTTMSPKEGQDEPLYEVFLIMEYCTNGNFCEYLSKRKQISHTLTEAEVLHFAVQIAEGIEFLHLNHLIHRDIKTQNILLSTPPNSSHSHIKIGDLGRLKLMNQFKSYSIAGSAVTVAPEVLSEETRFYNEKSDVFSFGCVLYELCTLKTQLFAINLRKSEKQTHKQISSDLADLKFTKPFIQLVLSTLKMDPELRPTIFYVKNQLHNMKEKLKPKSKKLFGLHVDPSPSNTVPDLYLDDEHVLGSEHDPTGLLSTNMPSPIQNFAVDNQDVGTTTTERTLLFPGTPGQQSSSSTATEEVTEIDVTIHHDTETSHMTSPLPHLHTRSSSSETLYGSLTATDSLRKISNYTSPLPPMSQEKEESEATPKNSQPSAEFNIEWGATEFFTNWVEKALTRYMFDQKSLVKLKEVIVEHDITARVAVELMDEKNWKEIVGMMGPRLAIVQEIRMLKYFTKR